MNSRRVWLKLSTVLSFLSVRWIVAEKVQQTVFALPDEAAECRYLKSLWQSAAAAQEKMRQLRLEGEDLAAQGSREAATAKIQICGTTAANLTTGAMLKVTATVRVIESKHGTLPACAAQHREQRRRGVSEATTLGGECALRAQFLAKGSASGKEPFLNGGGSSCLGAPPLSVGGRIR
jgi:hypothetical protein